jgi:cobalt-zinc-cadmium efflux system outer membrane protein
MWTANICARFISSITRERRVDKRVVALACLGSATGACAHYTPVPLDPVATAQAYTARRLDAADLTDWLAAHGSKPSSGGWRGADLALVALYYQPAVERARAGWLAARAAERTAGARPQPDLQSELGYATSAAVFESRWYSAVNAIFTLELGGKRGARVVAARARTAVAETDLEGTAWRLTRAVRAGTVELAAARERLSDASAGAGRIAQFAERLRRRYAEGTLSRSELAAIESEEADARAAAAREREAVAAARVALAQAAGLPAGALDGLAIAPEPAPVCSTAGGDSLQSLALRRRPEVGRGLAEYAVAEGDLRVAVAGAYPDLSLGPGFIWDQGIGRWSLLLGLPRLALNRNRGPIGEAMARRKEAGARFAEQQQTVLEEVAAAVAACRLALADVAGADSVRQATARQAELARAAYDRGELSATALEPLELAETRALRDLHGARQRLAAAALALETVAGEWPPGEVRWPDPREPVRGEEEASR